MLADVTAQFTSNFAASHFTSLQVKIHLSYLSEKCKLTERMEVP